REGDRGYDQESDWRGGRQVGIHYGRRVPSSRDYGYTQARPGSNFSNPGWSEGGPEGSNANYPGRYDQDRGYGRESRYSRSSRMSDQGSREWGEEMGGDSGESESWGSRSEYRGGREFGRGPEFGSSGWQGDRGREAERYYGDMGRGPRREYGSPEERGGSGGQWNYGGQRYGPDSGYMERAGGWGMRPGEGSGAEGYSTAGQRYGGGYDPYGQGRSYGGQQYGQSRQYSGLGPKGYHRSDDRLKEDICDRLTQHSGIDASDIEVQVRDAEVTLTGMVADRNQKRMAEDTVESVYGVKDVSNQLRLSQRAMGGGEEDRRRASAAFGGDGGATGSQQHQYSGATAEAQGGATTAGNSENTTP
ncbi:MAG: BON domain-containing protein, partial [Hyphomicrobiales bacterium]